MSFYLDVFSWYIGCYYCKESLNLCKWVLFIIPINSQQVVSRLSCRILILNNLIELGNVEVHDGRFSHHQRFLRVKKPNPRIFLIWNGRRWTKRQLSNIRQSIDTSSRHHAINEINVWKKLELVFEQNILGIYIFLLKKLVNMELKEGTSIYNKSLECFLKYGKLVDYYEKGYGWWDASLLVTMFTARY